MMKTIGFLLYDFQNGGAQNIMIKTANLLCENYRIKLFVINNKGPLKERVNKKVEIIDLKGKKLRSSLYALIRAINIHKPSFIISTLLAPSLLLIFANFFSLFKSRIIYREASSPSLEPNESFKKKILKICGKLFLPYTYRIIAVSNGVKQDLIKTYKIKADKIEVIYNPVFSLKNIDIKKINRRKFNDGNLSILFVGRVAKVKRIELQLHAISILIKNNIQATYTIAGNCPDIEYHNKLKTIIKELKIENNVNWLGYVEDVYSIMSSHQILLLTSKYEGFPSVLVEGLISGLNIIACDCPNGPDEILDSGRIGVLINNDKCTPKKIAENILDIYKGRIDLSENYSILSQFSKELVSKKYFEMIESKQNN